MALDDAVSVEVKESKHKTRQGNGEGNLDESRGQNGNWVMKVLRVKSQVNNNNTEEEIQKMGNESETCESAAPGSSDCEESESCDCVYDEDEVDFDRTSFSKLLKKVSLSQAKLYAQLSHLGSLAYDIPNIKVTSSLLSLQFIYSVCIRGL